MSDGISQIHDTIDCAFPFIDQNVLKLQPPIWVEIT